MTLRILKRTGVFLLLAVILGYLAVWRMAGHSPGDGDPAWQRTSARNKWSKFMGPPGGRLHYLETGRGPTVVLVHGYADSSYSWHRNIEALAAAGFHVLAPDLPGMGLSDPPRGRDFSPKALADALLTLLDDFNLKKVDWVGHSLGGGLTLYLAWQHPERVNRIIPVDPACYPDYKQRFLASMARAPILPAVIKPLLGPWVFHLGLRLNYFDPSRVSPALVSQKARSFRRKDFAANLIELGGDFFSNDFLTMSGVYSSINTPTLLIWGATDRLVSTENYARRLRADIPGARLKIIPKSGHLPHQEQAGTFNKLVVDFLKNGPL